MKQALDKFEAYLSKNQSRITAQKKQIVEQIFKIKQHFEVEEFIYTIRQGSDSISRATIYRTIKQLLDSGLLQKIRTRDGKIYYEHNLDQKQHAHIICNECGKMYEIKDPALEACINLHCQNIQFQPEYQSLHIYGKCINCQEDNT